MFDRELLKSHVKWAEAAQGPDLFPYKDSLGILTIGYGRNLVHRGITVAEADFLLENDLFDAENDASGLSYWNDLSPVRKIVIIDMIFNLGLSRFKRFIRLNAALGLNDWNLAAYEMKDSRWYKQTTRRAKVIVKAMRTGVWKNA